MATDRSFSALLNDYVKEKMLTEELIKRDYFLQAFEMDQDWSSGDYVIPFKKAGASSVKMGGLTAAADINQSQYVRGVETDRKELWASLVFNSRDLKEHGGKIPEKTFLKLLPNELEMLMGYMKEVLSMAFTNGAVLATVTDATNAATGILIVDKIDRFQIGQKVTLDDNNSAEADYFVTAVNVNTNAVTLSATAGGAAADVSAYSVAQVAVFYIPGATSESFNSIKSILLSAANGGSANVHGVSKLSAPILQSVNVSGSAISASNILSKIFDAYTEVRAKAKGNASVVVLSYKHLGSIMKLLDAQKGAFSMTEQPKANVYGWTEIEVTSVKGRLKIVGIQEMADTEIFILDPKSFVIASNGGVRKEKTPEGLEYFTLRNTTGYQYIVDMSFAGQLICKTPGHNAIIHSVANY